MASRGAPRGPASPRVTEGIFADLAKLIRDKGVQTPAQAQEFIEKVLKASGGKIPKAEPRTQTPLEQAQAMMYRAFEEPKKALRLKMAAEALRISPDCADAYSVMAMDGGGSPEEQIKLWQAAVQAGERGLGKAFFDEHVGDFWGLIETRPYMRARYQLARCLWWEHRRDEAIVHAIDLLRLNPGDNQGVRYYLLRCFGVLGDTIRMKELLERRSYRGEASCDWQYTRALVAFIEEGASSAAAKLLRKAIKGNRHVPAYLLGKKAIPKDSPEFIEAGGPSEAVSYAQGFSPVWAKTSGALVWLAASIR